MSEIAVAPADLKGKACMVGDLSSFFRVHIEHLLFTGAHIANGHEKVAVDELKLIGACCNFLAVDGEGEGYVDCNSRVVLCVCSC